MGRLRLAAALFLVAYAAMVAWSRRPQPDLTPPQAEHVDVALGSGEPDRGPMDLSAQADQTSIVVVSLDTLRFDHTGIGGHAGDLTPRLDALAAQGVAFQDAVSPAPWTLPAHMSIWTGLWPSAHGITNKLRSTGQGTWEDAVLDPGIPTLPQSLAAAGWRLGAFTGGSGVLGGYGFDRGFEVYEDEGRFGGLDAAVPAALAWLEEQGDQRTLLFLHGYDAHGQHPLPADVLSELVGDSRLDGSIAEQEALREQLLKHLGGGDAEPPDLTAGDRAFLRRVYEAKVRSADAQLGRFLDGLDALGLSERTLVAVVSDHGDELFDHGGLDHGATLYQEQLQAVLVLRWPGQEGGRPIRQGVRTLDLFPTILDALGLPLSDGLDGVSLMPLLHGEPWEPPPLHAETDFRMVKNLRMVRQGTYKLILDLGDGSSELYDLARDPDESEDLSEAEPRRTYELEQAVKRWMAETRPP